MEYKMELPIHIWTQSKHSDADHNTANLQSEDKLELIEENLMNTDSGRGWVREVLLAPVRAAFKCSSATRAGEL